MFRLQIARDCAAIRSRCNGDESAALTAPLARAGRSEPSEGVALLPYIDPIAELRCIVGDRVRGVLALAIFLALASYATNAEAYARNNRHWVNSSDHLVRSPSCGLEHLRRDALCRNGSVSFSEHRRGTCSHYHSVAHSE
jgi:hypothetical protein